MKTFNQFINEGIRDKMTGKSEEDIRKSLDKLPNTYEKLNKIYKYNINLYSDEEIKSMLKDLEPYEKYRLGIDYNIFWLVKEALDEELVMGDDERYIMIVDEDLVYACRYENYELLELLLNEGDVTIYILEQAIHMGNIEIVQLLLDHDDEGLLRDNFRDLIYVAKHNKDKPMVDFLQQYKNENEE